MIKKIFKCVFYTLLIMNSIGFTSCKAKKSSPKQIKYLITCFDYAYAFSLEGKINYERVNASYTCHQICSEVTGKNKYALNDNLNLDRNLKVRVFDSKRNKVFEDFLREQVSSNREYKKAIKAVKPFERLKNKAHQWSENNNTHSLWATIVIKLSDIDPDESSSYEVEILRVKEDGGIEKLLYYYTLPASEISSLSQIDPSVSKWSNKNQCYEGRKDRYSVTN